MYDWEIRAWAKRSEVLREMAEEASSALEVALSPAIRAWPEKVPCGHTGGWYFGSCTQDTVTLVHDCFSAHGYDRHEEHETTASLDSLLSILERQKGKTS